ncbi:N-6 DNA methylase [Xenorhabdus littoralis]|uniref:class I SAM-dependent DNA methyltransferase n=1 Tax=Xenorhabdus littoralis TaxID=2582835 RepID=UPI0029E7E6CA|nr:N-6 DNA methylase [Xenorhabdus sp. psl]MDX7991770.1 SAM-dependent methyltransferase [Xenorhabdus sp. psl]
MSNNDIVQKLWNLCNVLRDDGINYSDYVTELVLLLFIKMVHEKTESNTLDKHTLPEGCRWTDLNSKSGITLLNDYKQILLKLSTGKDAEGKVVHADPLISAIYADAQTRLREPRHLKQLISNFDQIDWYSAQKDGLGDLYEGLLEKNANETKSGAGQYFTPRPLIDSMVRCLKPQPGELIQDPAAGTAGFLVSADKYIKSNTDDLYSLSAKDKLFQKTKAFVGVELVPSTRRLALMNCLLHEMDGGEEGVVLQGNALGMVGASLAKANVIFANPPFGTSKGGEASITRDDLTYRTTNKQLAFLQHIYRNLQPGGRAAVVVPDNVLFEAGVGTEVRRDLMNKCNLHTILRLPTGIFYAQGVKTNVLFFNKGSAKDKFQDENCTENVWVYDLRINMPSFGKRTPFNESHLKPFETVYGKLPDGSSPRTGGEWSFSADKIEISDSSENQNVEERLKTSRWRTFSRKWIRENRDDSLDITWLQDNNSIDAGSLPEPSVLAKEAKQGLTAALAELNALLAELGEGDKNE